MGFYGLVFLLPWNVQQQLLTCWKPGSILAFQSKNAALGWGFGFWFALFGFFFVCFGVWVFFASEKKILFPKSVPRV